MFVGIHWFIYIIWCRPSKPWLFGPPCPLLNFVCFEKKPPTAPPLVHGRPDHIAHKRLQRPKHKIFCVLAGRLCAIRPGRPCRDVCIPNCMFSLFSLFHNSNMADTPQQRFFLINISGRDTFMTRAKRENFLSIPPTGRVKKYICPLRGRDQNTFFFSDTLRPCIPKRRPVKWGGRGEPMTADGEGGRSVGHKKDVYKRKIIVKS